MTKGELIYMLRNALVGDTPTQEAGVRFSEKQLEAVLDVAYESLVRQEYRGHPTQLDPYTNWGTVSVTVAADGTGSFTVPYPTMNLAGIGGVRSIGSRTHPYGVFNRIDFDMLQYLINSDVGVVGGETFWWEEGNTVRFVRMDQSVTSLNVAYLRKFASYAFTDTIMMPAGRADVMIDIAKKMAIEGLPVDQDGSDTSNVKTQ